MGVGKRETTDAPRGGVTARLLRTFASVELKPEHLNHGNEYPSLRHYGFSPVVARALIRWGEERQLVATFENAEGRSNNAYSWMPAFLQAAVDKHVELHGAAGLQDLPAALLERFPPTMPDVPRPRARG